MAAPVVSRIPRTRSASVTAFAVGTVIGALVVGGFFGLVTYAAGAGTAGAVAVGIFAALMGGPGFGGMMGFVLQRSREDERHEQVARQRTAERLRTERVDVRR